MMEQPERKDNRLLSELVDLKLTNTTSTSSPSDESGGDNKRKAKKIGALRATYDTQIYENFT